MNKDTHLRTFLFDPFNDILYSIHIHRLILVHVDRQTAASYQEQHKLVNCFLLSSLIARGALIRFDPIFNGSLEGDIGVQQGVWASAMLLVTWREADQEGELKEKEGKAY